MSTYAQRSSTGQPRDYDDKSWKHPGESGRVSAWLRRSKRDLEMQPNVDGHPPSAIFQQRAASRNAHHHPSDTDTSRHDSLEITAPDASTGEAYIRRADGTPKLKRSINFTSPSLGEGVVAPAVTGVQVTNPKYKLHVWVQTARMGSQLVLTAHPGGTSTFG